MTSSPLHLGSYQFWFYIHEHEKPAHVHNFAVFEWVDSVEFIQFMARCVIMQLPNPAPWDEKNNEAKIYQIWIDFIKSKNGFVSPSSQRPFTYVTVTNGEAECAAALLLELAHNEYAHTY